MRLTIDGALARIMNRMSGTSFLSICVPDFEKSDPDLRFLRRFVFGLADDMGSPIGDQVAEEFIETIIDRLMKLNRHLPQNIALPKDQGDGWGIPIEQAFGNFADGSSLLYGRTPFGLMAIINLGEDEIASDNQRPRYKRRRNA